MFLPQKKEGGEQKETFRGNGYFIALIVVMVSQVYAYLQNQQIVYIKYVQFFLYINYIPIKLF